MEHSTIVDSIRKLLHLFVTRQGLRYIVIGSIAYIFEVIVIITAEQFGASPVAAVAISFWFGLLTTFVLHKLITFRDHRRHHTVVAAQLFAYGCLVAFNFGFTLLCIKLLEPYLPTGISRAIALAITVCWNYYLYTTRIFKDPTTTEKS